MGEVASSGASKVSSRTVYQFFLYMFAAVGMIASIGLLLWMFAALTGVLIPFSVQVGFALTLGNLGAFALFQKTQYVIGG